MQIHLLREGYGIKKIYEIRCSQCIDLLVIGRYGFWNAGVRVLCGKLSLVSENVLRKLGERAKCLDRI